MNRIPAWKALSGSMQMTAHEVFTASSVIQRAQKEPLFVCNFTPIERPEYRVGVPRGKQYRLVLNSDELQYGGSGKARPAVYKAKKQECDGRPYSFGYDLPPYGVAVFEF